MVREIDNSKKIQISISIPKSVVKSIDKMAVSENRTRSNFILSVFDRLAKETLGKIPDRKNPGQ
ncbi:MAG: ribbon-helix-helix protein, CopG family [Opitutales bacterium]|nr:ribbon-helix-helix protein, CopG family [Opitutales bacterium]